MANLPVLVEDVLSANESVDDQYSFFSTSSIESYDEKLKAIYNDHDSGTQWINQFNATPPWSLEVNIRKLEAIDNIDKSQYLAGSTIDMTRPSSPIGLCNSPYLDISPPTYDKKDIEAPSIKEDFPQGDQVVHLKCTIRTIGLTGDGEMIPKFPPLDQSPADSIMADTGANSCMADSEMHLVNCQDIKPVRIGLALKSSGLATHYTCTQMGYLPNNLGGWPDALSTLSGL